MAVRERWKGTKRIGLSTSECVDLLLPATVRDVRVDAVYLFGSRAAGVGHADSDVDLAIYTTDDYEWDDLFALRGTAHRPAAYRTIGLGLAQPRQSRVGVFGDTGRHVFRALTRELEMLVESGDAR